MKVRNCLVLAAALCAAPVAWAEGLAVEPGLWEMTSTVTMPMFPEPKVNTVNECFDKSEISMDDMNGDEANPDCKFEMTELSDNTMKWMMDCPMQGGTSHAEFEATSGGDTITGGGVMTISMQGQTMEMTMEWKGHRTGSCP